MEKKVILDFILKFILVLYGNASYPRKIVQKVVQFLTEFLRNIILKSLKNEIILILQSHGIDKNCQSEIEFCIDKYATVCDEVSTESRRFAILAKKGFFFPVEFAIGEAYVKKIVSNVPKYVPEMCFGARVPLQKTFKLFLETPGIFKQIINYIEYLKKEIVLISNILQSDLWLKKYAVLFQDVLVLPFWLFVDAFECGNALSGKAGKNKFEAIYAALACLPSNISSKLSSIIFSTLIPSEEKKKLHKTPGANQKIFGELIQEINSLQREGIEINLEGKATPVKFQLALITGDNLGLNEIFGFVTSFNTSYCCRICKATLHQIQTLTKEDLSLLRTKENYKSDVDKKCVEETGIKEECVSIILIISTYLIILAWIYYMTSLREF